MINIIRSSEDYVDHVLQEARKPVGLEHFYDLLYAIKSKKVLLSFSYEQGQYLKTFPLHHSQKVVEENDEVIIELFIVVTYDFVMELLSFGEEVTVLKPISLIYRMKKTYSNALSKYS